MSTTKFLATNKLCEENIWKVRSFLSIDWGPTSPLISFAPSLLPHLDSEAIEGRGSPAGLCLVGVRYCRRPELLGPVNSLLWCVVLPLPVRKCGVLLSVLGLEMKGTKTKISLEVSLHRFWSRLSASSFRRSPSYVCTQTSGPSAHRDSLLTDQPSLTFSDIDELWFDVSVCQFSIPFIAGVLNLETNWMSEVFQ